MRPEPLATDGTALTDAARDTASTLEAALERETARREAAQRDAERARQNHEDAYERLLTRCRQLQDEKLRWSEDARRGGLAAAEAGAKAEQEHRDAMARQALAFEQERARAEQALQRAHLDERTRLAADHDRAIAEADDRLHAARRDLAQAETEFRIEAYRLSSLVALKSQDADEATAEAEAARLQLRLVLASTSWTLTRPIRVASRLLRRAARAPRRLARALRPEPP